MRYWAFASINLLIVLLSAAVGAAQAPSASVLACAEQAPDAFVKSAARAAIPLKTVAPGSSFDDLRRVSRLVGDARVVGIGEAARSVHEFYQVRHRLLEFLVEEMGFTAFAMETGFAEATKLNDFVLGRIGEPQDWRQWFTFGYGDEEELQALVRWMRAYNDNPHHKRKLRFYGIDVMVPYSSPMTALEYSFKYLDSVDQWFASSATRQQLTAIVQKFLGSGGSLKNMEISVGKYLDLPGADRDAYTAALADLVARFESRRAEYTNRSSEDSYHWNYQTAVAARQLDTTYRAAAAVISPGQRLEVVRAQLPRAIWSARDAAMLENVMWALDREGQDGRIVLWAHNAHVSKGSVSSLRPDVVGLWETGPRLGLLLEQVMGSRYVAIGTSYGAGRSGRQQQSREQPTCGTLDRELARLNLSVFLLDLSAAAADKEARAWLSTPRVMRADNPGSDYRLIPAEAWDAVLFVREMSPVRVRP